jgi:hypothetical protein
MKIKEGMTCYYCGGKAVSSEHVPPRCFFPKDKRYSLIQVPACEKHNESTSIDDSYVLFIISSFIGNNEVGNKHSINKGIKPVLRSEALQTVIKENSIDAFADSGNGLMPTKIISIDRDRFDEEIRKMAYALYFHTYNHRWNRELYVGTNSMLCSDGGIEELGALINNVKEFLEKSGFNQTNPFSGSNPDVFKYRFLETEKADEPILQIIFYGSFEVWVFVKIDI